MLHIISAAIVAATTLTGVSASAAAPPQASAAQAGAAQEAVSQAGAAKPTPLPDVALIARNGTTVSTATATNLPAQGHWLLIHVQRGSMPCEALLGRIQGDAWTTVPPRLAIIVANATAADVDKLAAQYPALEGAAWFADQPGALAAALQIQEAPVVLALNDRGIKWTLAGVLSGSKRLQGALTGWVQTPQ
jgi:hypothetical protein